MPDRREWVESFHVSEYLAGLWDFDGTNVVAATNQVAIADLDPEVPGFNMVFAGFDGRIHRVGADRVERFATRDTTRDDVLTAGVAIADLSGDGRPEIVFTTYSPTPGVSALYVLDSMGEEQHRIPLPDRGGMPVPTIADVDGDGVLEIVVSAERLRNRQRSTAMVSMVTGGSSSDSVNGWARYSNAS